MAEFRIIKPLSFSHGSVTVRYFRRDSAPDLVEIHTTESVLRMTINEFDYISNEVSRVRPD